MKACSCSSQRQNKSILSFLAPPYQPASAKAMLDNYPGKSTAVRLSCSLPDYRHYSPPPINCPRPLCSARLVKRVCDQRRNKWRRTGWLLARAGYVSPCCKVMCLWYMCFCAEVFFSLLTLYSSMEHSLGVKKYFFFPPFPHVMLSFSSIPCLPVLYVCIHMSPCMYVMYGQVDGLFHWYL